MPQITPSVARISYDSQLGIWKMHPSRYVKTTGTRFDRDTVREFVSLLELIQELLIFWAMLGVGGSTTRNGPENAENLAAFIVWLQSTSLATAEPDVIPEGTPVDDAIDFEAMTEYDGETDDWGETAP